MSQKNENFYSNCGKYINVRTKKSILKKFESLKSQENKPPLDDIISEICDTYNIREKSFWNIKNTDPHPLKGLNLIELNTLLVIMIMKLLMILFVN